MTEIAVIILAAGTSSRAGPVNKLLSSYRGKPMVAYPVHAAQGLSNCPVIVVTGHQSELVKAVLSEFDVKFVNNPAYAEGMSTSLKAGIAALPESVSGAIVCLGDMPRITTGHLQKLIDDCEGDETICVPMFNGKQGNPVLWGRQYFADILNLSGDVGAKSLLRKYATAIKRVEMSDDAVLFDIDQPQGSSN